jgi:hypothetical protein
MYTLDWTVVVTSGKYWGLNIVSEELVSGLQNEV